MLDVAAPASAARGRRAVGQLGGLQAGEKQDRSGGKVASPSRRSALTWPVGEQHPKFPS